MKHKWELLYLLFAAALLFALLAVPHIAALVMDGTKGHIVTVWQ